MWHLPLVLRYLIKAPFEPARKAHLRDLTRKAAFLVALASGRRCSEVNGLSGIPQDIGYEKDGSISLRFLPEFLAKNQIPGVPSPVINIKELTPFLADPEDADRLLCPVRILYRYIDRTRTIRHQGQRCLFISHNPGYEKDITRATISRWISELVREAYADAGRQLEHGSARAHEIRAWATSAAFSHGLPLAQVLDAAYWFTPDSFTSFYLRDVQRQRDDGSFGLPSAVYAQHVLSSSRR